MLKMMSLLPLPLNVRKKLICFFNFMSKVLKKETLTKTVKVPFEIVN